MIAHEHEVAELGKMTIRKAFGVVLGEAGGVDKVLPQMYKGYSFHKSKLISIGQTNLQ
jgi:hypothetical protein